MNYKTAVSREFKGLRLVGGQAGLDLLNTVKYRGKVNDGDRFTEFSDIIEWALLAEIIDEPEFKLLNDLSNKQHNFVENKSLFEEICDFREAARIIFDTEKHDSVRFDKALKYLEQIVSKLRPSVNINRKTVVLEKFYPIDELIDLKIRIIACIDKLLQNRAKLTIKTCMGVDCDWLFSDYTKAKRRKWCDTRTCGNLARVRKYRSV